MQAFDRDSGVTNIRSGRRRRRLADSRPTSVINLKAEPKGRAQPFIIPRHDWPRALEPNECTLSNDRLVSLRLHFPRLFLFLEPQRLIPQVELQSSTYHAQGRG